MNCWDFVVARTIDEAASRDIGAGEERKIQLAVIFYSDGFRCRPACASE